MKVAALQTDIVWEDPTANFHALGPRLVEARDAGARLLLLPEMYACGFSMRTDVTAETPDGPSTTFLRDHADALGVWVGGSVPVREEGRDRPHNTFLLAGPTGELHRYRKIHPWTVAEYGWASPGENVPAVVDTPLGRIGIMICYDVHAQLPALAEAGAVLIVTPVWWVDPRPAFWFGERLPALCRQHGVALAAANRGASAAEGERPGAGHSCVISAEGRVLARAACDGTDIVVAAVSLPPGSR